MTDVLSRREGELDGDTAGEQPVDIKARVSRRESGGASSSRRSSSEKRRQSLWEPFWDDEERDRREAGEESVCMHDSCRDREREYDVERGRDGMLVQEGEEGEGEGEEGEEREGDEREGEKSPMLLSCPLRADAPGLASERETRTAQREQEQEARYWYNRGRDEGARAMQTEQREQREQREDGGGRSSGAGSRDGGMLRCISEVTFDPTRMSPPSGAEPMGGGTLRRISGDRRGWEAGGNERWTREEWAERGEISGREEGGESGRKRGFEPGSWSSFQAERGERRPGEAEPGGSREQGGASSGRAGSSAQAGPRSCARAWGRVERAAYLVQEAMAGRWVPLEAVRAEGGGAATRWVEWYRKGEVVRAAMVVTLLLLPFFELPAWCATSRPSPPPCGDPSLYALSGLPYLPHRLTLLLEAGCVAVALAFLALQRCILGGHSFWRNHVALYKLAAAMGIVTERALSSSLHRLAPHLATRLLSVPIAPYLRILLAILFSRSIRGCFRTTLRIIASFLDIAILLTVFVVSFAWLAFLIFGSDATTAATTTAAATTNTTHAASAISTPTTLSFLHSTPSPFTSTPPPSPLHSHALPSSALPSSPLLSSSSPSVFSSLPSSLRAMFILITTANNPNVWLPQLAASRLSFLFFASYLALGLFCMNAVLSVVYSSYSSQMAVWERKQVTARQACLREAFGLLDERRRGWLPASTITHLLRTMAPFSSHPDQASHISALFLRLDTRGDLRIWADEFEGLCDALGQQAREMRAAERGGRGGMGGWLGEWGWWGRKWWGGGVEGSGEEGSGWEGGRGGGGMEGCEVRRLEARRLSIVASAPADDASASLLRPRAPIVPRASRSMRSQGSAFAGLYTHQVPVHMRSQGDIHIPTSTCSQTSLYSHQEPMHMRPQSSLYTHQVPMHMRSQGDIHIPTSTCSHASSVYSPPTASAAPDVHVPASLLPRTSRSTRSQSSLYTNQVPMHMRSQGDIHIPTSTCSHASSTYSPQTASSNATAPAAAAGAPFPSLHAHPVCPCCHPASALSLAPHPSTVRGIESLQEIGCEAQEGQQSRDWHGCGCECCEECKDRQQGRYQSLQQEGRCLQDWWYPHGEDSTGLLWHHHRHAHAPYNQCRHHVHHAAAAADDHGGGAGGAGGDNGNDGNADRYQQLVSPPFTPPLLPSPSSSSSASLLTSSSLLQSLLLSHPGSPRAVPAPRAPSHLSLSPSPPPPPPFTAAAAAAAREAAAPSFAATVWQRCSPRAEQLGLVLTLLLLAESNMNLMGLSTSLLVYAQVTAAAVWILLFFHHCWCCWPHVFSPSWRFHLLSSLPLLSLALLLLLYPIIHHPSAFSALASHHNVDQQQHPYYHHHRHHQQHQQPQPQQRFLRQEVPSAAAGEGKSGWRFPLSSASPSLAPLLPTHALSSLQAALLFRCLPLLPLAHYLPRLHLLLSSLSAILPSILPILALLFTALSLFSLIGTHLFGGLLFSSHPQLQQSEYLDSGFLPLNFNDFAAAMGVSFNLCIVNNWYVVMDGVSAVLPPGQEWRATAFFALFYVVIVVFVLNVVVAFILEAFVKELKARGSSS